MDYSKTLANIEPELLQRIYQSLNGGDVARFRTVSKNVLKANAALTGDAKLLRNNKIDEAYVRDMIKKGKMSAPYSNAFQAIHGVDTANLKQELGRESTLQELLHYRRFRRRFAAGGGVTRAPPDTKYWKSLFGLVPALALSGVLYARHKKMSTQQRSRKSRQPRFLLKSTHIKTRTK